MNKEIALYFHIPFCLSKCSYCDFFSIPVLAASPKKIIPDKYIDALCNELNYKLKNYGECFIKTIYIGGGTPSLLTVEQIKKLTCAIKKYPLAENFEFTFEMNPDDVSEVLIKALEECGITRISLGVQSFCDTVLKSVHRRADFKIITRAMQLLKTYWYKNLSVDLICGIPGETEKSLITGLESLVKAGIAHISLYSLCIEEETPLGKGIINGNISYNQDTSDLLWIKGRDYLIKSGYVQYEVSNFCLQGFECVHNMVYWAHKDYLGFGAGATGTLYNSDGSGLRTVNKNDIDLYQNFWGDYSKVTQADAFQTACRAFEIEELSVETSIFEYFMMGLRTNRGVSLREYESIFKAQMNSNIVKKLEAWQEKGLCIIKNEMSFKGEKDVRYILSESGLLFLNKLLEDLI